MPQLVQLRSPSQNSTFCSTERKTYGLDRRAELQRAEHRERCKMTSITPPICLVGPMTPSIVPQIRHRFIHPLVTREDCDPDNLACVPGAHIRLRPPSNIQSSGKVRVELVECLLRVTDLVFRPKRIRSPTLKSYVPGVIHHDTKFPIDSYRLPSDLLEFSDGATTSV